MKKIVTPVFQNRISPRLDYAESFLMTETEENRILRQETIKLLSKNRLEKLNTLIELKPDIIICDGITDVYAEKLKRKNIQVIPWIHGNVNEVLTKYLNRRLHVDKLKKKSRVNKKEKE